MHSIMMSISLNRRPGLRSRVAAVLLVLMSTLSGGMMPSMAHAGAHPLAVFEQGCVHVDGALSSGFTGHSYGMNCCAGMGALCAFHCTHAFLAPMTLSHGGTGISMPMATSVSLPTQTFPVPPWHPPKAA
jgi:hypothetical protein